MSFFKGLMYALSLMFYAICAFAIMGAAIYLAPFGLGG